MIIDFFMPETPTPGRSCVSCLHIISNQYLDFSLPNPNVTVTPANKYLDIEATEKNLYRIQINNGNIPNGMYLLMYHDKLDDLYIISSTYISLLNGKQDILYDAKRVTFIKASN